MQNLNTVCVSEKGLHIIHKKNDLM